MSSSRIHQQSDHDDRNKFLRRGPIGATQTVEPAYDGQRQSCGAQDWKSLRKVIVPRILPIKEGDRGEVDLKEVEGSERRSAEVNRIEETLSHESRHTVYRG